MQQSPLYVIASPRPRVGKTLLARLLMELFRSSDRALVGYDLNPREPSLAGRFPPLVWTIDITETTGQMELFDRLLADPSSTQVIDLGYAAFEQFFEVMGEIGFAQEARQRSIEPVVLFVADPAPATMRTYGDLRDALPQVTFVPVHNESVSVLFAKEDFPPTRAECGTIHLSRLSPIVRGVLDRPSFSFAAHLTSPQSGPTEIHQWVNSIFNELRQLELKLLMGQLTSALGGASQPLEFRRAR
jgi:hypothetical protein